MSHWHCPNCTGVIRLDDEGTRTCPICGMRLILPGDDAAEQGNVAEIKRLKEECRKTDLERELLANQYKKNENYDEALKLYTEIVDELENSSRIHLLVFSLFEMSEIYKILGDEDKAESCIFEAIGRRPLALIYKLEIGPEEEFT